MTCPKCSSTNVNVQIVQTGSTTDTKKKGCLFTLGRLLLIVCTGGLWLLFGKKAAKSKTTVSNEKRALCQTCGESWVV